MNLEKIDPLSAEDPLMIRVGWKCSTPDVYRDIYMDIAPEKDLDIKTMYDQMLFTFQDNVLAVNATLMKAQEESILAAMTEEEKLQAAVDLKSELMGFASQIPPSVDIDVEDLSVLANDLNAANIIL